MLWQVHTEQNKKTKNMKTTHNTTKRILKAALFTLVFAAISFGQALTSTAATTATNDKAVTAEQITTVTSQMLANPTFWPDFIKETDDTPDTVQAAGIDEMVKDSLWWQHQLNQFIQAENDSTDRS